MNYLLKNKDTLLLSFTLTPSEEIAEIRWAERAAQPPSLQNCGDLGAWLRARRAPETRPNIALCARQDGIASFRDYLDKTCCLSLRDSLWVTKEDDRRRYADVSPYRGKLDRRTAETALWGHSELPEEAVPSPEYSTPGSRPKCWEKGPTGRLFLVRRASSPNTREPHSDYYVPQLLQALGVERYAHYDLTQRNGEICSLSRCFTDELLGFLPISQLGLGDDLAALEQYYRKYHQFRFLRKMFLADALTLNPSRRPDKFGFQAVNGSRGIIWGAPLFGHGDALLSKAPEEVFTSPAKLEDYASSLTPALGDDFISVARFFSSERDLELLAHIRSDFSFRPHPEHPLPPHILDALSALVRTQAGRILEHA